MATTNHLGITLVEQAQSQKEVTVNQALTRLDSLLNTGAITRSSNTPPGSPVTGDLYIVGSSPTGDWSGHAEELAYYDQIWRFITPNEGLTLWVDDEDLIYTYDGSGWVASILGETNTASNLGSGSGVYGTKVGADLRFKSLVAGTNISLSSTNNDITINATGGASSYQTIQEEGSDLTQRSKLNFIGGGFTAADDSGNSRTNITLDATLNALAAYNTNGIICQTAADTFAGRTLTGPAAGITVSNGTGVSGNPTLALANDLSAVEGLSSNGLAVRTTTDTWTTRTLTAPATGITVSNGDGVSGNPTLALANDLGALEGLSSIGIACRTAGDTWTLRSIAGGSGIVVTDGFGLTQNPTISINARRTMWVPAAAMRPSSSGGCAALALIATSSNHPDISSLDFDASTEEYAQFWVGMPKGWDEGTIAVQFLWSHASTSTNFGVVWGIQGVAVSDDDTIDAAYGTAQTATDTGGTTSDLYISPETSAITIGGSPATGDMVAFRVYRKAADGSDTMAVDARLHGIKLYYNINTIDDL